MNTKIIQGFRSIYEIAGSILNKKNKMYGNLKKKKQERGWTDK